MSRWILLGLTAAFTFAACGPIRNYDDPNGPIYQGGYADQRESFDGELKVVTWNLNYVDAPDAVLRALGEHPDLRDADVIMLQEASPTSADMLAQKLGYNYAYTPGSVHRHHGEDFGNAIFSRWPLGNVRRLLLPGSGSDLQHNRVAIRADLQTGQEIIVVTSTHIETLWPFRPVGTSQVDFLIETIGTQDPLVVVGGDFNSAAPGSV